MPHKCAVAGCRGNYKGEPYSPMTRPRDSEERNRWLNCLPNDKFSLEGRKTLWLCQSHFECEWVKCRAGKRPTGCPTKFPSVSKASCMQTAQKHVRETKCSLAGARLARCAKLEQSRDNISFSDLQGFVEQCRVRFPEFFFRIDKEEVGMSLLDSLGRKVVVFLLFSVAKSDFGPIRFLFAEKDGHKVPRNCWGVRKDGIVGKWSTMDTLVSRAKAFSVPDESKVAAALESLGKLSETTQSSKVEFVSALLETLLLPHTRMSYPKNLMMLASELLCCSPAAYRLLRRLNLFNLPHEDMVRAKMAASISEESITSLLGSLPREQRFVNILFDEVKTKAGLQFRGSHIIGHAQNQPEQVATSALAIEVVCHHGGPKVVLRVVPVHQLKSDELVEMLLDAISLVIRGGGHPVALIGDNCPLNQSAYRKLGGPGRVHLSSQNVHLHLIYDYVHIFKNLRNNWITERQQELEFEFDGEHLIAKWADIIKLYRADVSSPFRLTKLTYSSVFPKPLQRQSVPLVCQVFNDKTVAALKAMQRDLDIARGTIVFVGMVTDWFTMLNVKDIFAEEHLLDSRRSKWQPGCKAFSHLLDICQVFGSLRWDQSGMRCRKLTKFTSDAFLTTSKGCLAVAKDLIEKHGFDYILPAVFGQDPLEKFFGQARQRNAGNFYINVTDVLAAQKAQVMHQLLKYLDTPKVSSDTAKHSCGSCTVDLAEADLELLDQVSIDDTWDLIDKASEDPGRVALRHKVVYVAGYLSRKYMLEEGEEETQEEQISSEFLTQLSRGGLSAPTLRSAFLVQVATSLTSSLPHEKRGCCRFLARILAHVDAPMARSPAVCLSLAKIVLKAQILAVSDLARKDASLRRQEKLTL